MIRVSVVVANSARWILMLGLIYRTLQGCYSPIPALRLRSGSAISSMSMASFASPATFMPQSRDNDLTFSNRANQPIGPKRLDLLNASVATPALVDTAKSVQARFCPQPALSVFYDVLWL